MKALFFFFSIAVSLSAQDHPQFVWQGQVDGTVILHLAAKHLAVQIQDGAPVERQKFHFSDALPQSQENVRVQVLEGRGYVHIVDQPNIENHYTLTLAIEDRQPGSSFYSIALNWNTSSNIFEGAQQKTNQVTWTGRVDEAAIVSCHARKCVSSSEPGAPASAPVSNESFQFSRPLPEREVDVRLEYPEGRGEIRLIEQPRHQNNYTARVSIHDPLVGAGEYSFTLVWNRLTSKELKEESKESAAISEPAERGLVWSGTLNGRVRVTLQGGASFSEVLEGARIQHEHAEILRRLPARADLMPAIQKLHGRGRASIVEAPSEKNNYRLIFEIDDPGPGADDYEVELDW